MRAYQCRRHPSAVLRLVSFLPLALLLAAFLALFTESAYGQEQGATTNNGNPSPPQTVTPPRTPTRPQSLYEKKILPENKFELNDLILILVSEDGSASNNSTINLRRKFDLDAEINKWIDSDGFTISPDTTDFPGVDVQTERKLEGRVATDRRERITFRIMARVVDVRPNDNLLIEGRITRLINDEESILSIFGEADPRDIHEQTRSIRSECIASKKLVYSGHGPLSRNLGRSILSFITEWLWPF